jgi:protein TonB
MSKADFVGYATGMRRRLLAHRRYPPAALRNGLEGVVKVKIGVDRRGRLVGEPTVAHSCGHPVLDDEALRMVRAASPFAPLPERADKEVVVFVIPLAFEIQVDG